MSNERYYLHRATVEEILAVQYVPENIARLWADDLATWHEPLRSFHPLEQASHKSSTWRIAQELGVQLVAEVVESQTRRLGPHYLDSDQTVRGIAVWQRRITIK